MIRFNNDYNHGAHPEILEALSAVNDNSFGGYGEDEWCKKAADLIRERVHCPDAAIHFFPGATQANFIVIASALSSVQSVIAADTGHINCHEAASVENTNHKIQTIPNTDGKITATQIDACAGAYYEENEPRGEYVLVLQGKSFEEIAEEEKKNWESMTLEEHMQVYESQGIARKEAMKLVAKDRGISKRDVYQALLL